ncbi:unnamed protein product [Parajaminaea phylloscopi]
MAATPGARITRELIQQWRSALHPTLSRGQDWYTVLSAAAASAHIGKEACPEIYRLTADECDATDEIGQVRAQAQAQTSLTHTDVEVVNVQRRMKESILKGAVLYGIPSALESTFALVEAIRAADANLPEDRRGRRRDEGFFLRKDQTIEGVKERGEAQLANVYRHNFPDIDRKFGTDMEDTKLLTIPVFYGLILSENRVLDFASTELVILSALIPQNFRNETLWHLRGCRRAGWDDEVIESVRRTALLIGDWAGKKMDQVPTLQDVSEQRND